MEVLEDEGTPLAECNRKDILLRLPEIDIYEWPRRVSGELLFQRPRPVAPAGVERLVDRQTLTREINSFKLFRMR
jgi:hypothetical protein